ncbi:MAG: hypothetical protein DRJ31_03940 [Candidatus Methanomethylicota archaeon]|uniref:V-type ATP synthase subunit F n=1 Tax=Thermoproteota archaeon TaxID=2056631 RepID=A0A497ERN7_9CREN|nr:MAG: hypothetical protein DRJ31_03940 [Candidatus Verstraetearchaeota archaeon]RLE53068.1 MAG: hypothetical protein DRJ33_02045 [Candidatus Verstraetearchaeota archaeon]
MGLSLKAVIIGGKETVTGFKLAGIEGIIVSTPHAMLEKLKELIKKEDIALILVDDQFLEPWAKEEVDKVKASSLSKLIIEIPSRSGPRVVVDLRELVKKVMGVKIG